MKTNYFQAVMAALLAALLAYMLYSFNKPDRYDIVCGLVSFVALGCTLIPAMALKASTPRLSVNLRVLSSCAFAGFLVLNLVYALAGIVMPYYVLLNGIGLILFLSVYYKLSRVRDI